MEGIYDNESGGDGRCCLHNAGERVGDKDFAQALADAGSASYADRVATDAADLGSFARVVGHIVDLLADAFFDLGDAQRGGARRRSAGTPVAVR